MKLLYFAFIGVGIAIIIGLVIYFVSRPKKKISPTGLSGLRSAATQLGSISAQLNQCLSNTGAIDNEIAELREKELFIISENSTVSETYGQYRQDIIEILDSISAYSDRIDEYQTLSNMIRGTDVPAFRRKTGSEKRRFIEIIRDSLFLIKLDVDSLIQELEGEYSSCSSAKIIERDRLLDAVSDYNDFVDMPNTFGQIGETIASFNDNRRRF